MKENQMRTRRISPWLGTLGLLGFIPIVGYIKLGDPNVLLFLAFFGFFRFYFEGKMSNTLIDERFEYNEKRAVAKTNQIISILMVCILIITVNWISPKGVQVAYTFLIATLALLWTLQAVLPAAVLYYYENKE